MKKLFYIVLTLSLFSCSTNDDSVENTQTDPELDRGYVFEMDQRFPLKSPELYYQFTYENGRLKNILGRYYPSYSGIGYFNANVLTQLTYTQNKVQIDYLEAEGVAGYKTVTYLMDHNRPIKFEQYQNYPGYPSYLERSKSYTYEQDKITTYEKRGGWELYTFYYFNNQKNLIKSETLEKTGGVDNKVTTTIYSDYDTAKNPFRKLYLVNEDFYEKGLSANNFRAKKTTSQYLPTPANGNMTYPPGYANSEWTYNYDSNGQVLLYFPLKKIE